MQRVQKYRIGQEVEKKLGIYVYRLIDPRSGETFYVGQGRNSRVFDHANSIITNASFSKDEDDLSLKIIIIRDIMKAGLQVQHVIHRHGLGSKAIADEVEAALIDAYPGLSNDLNGYGSRERGCRHIDQIVRIYESSEYKATEPLIQIHIGRVSAHRPPLDAVRAAWKMDIERARKRKLVLASDGGVIVGAYRPTDWFPATQERFTFLSNDEPTRIGFEGTEADDVKDQYLGKRARSRKRGSRSPFIYVEPS